MHHWISRSSPADAQSHSPPHPRRCTTSTHSSRYLLASTSSPAAPAGSDGPLRLVHTAPSCRATPSQFAGWLRRISRARCDPKITVPSCRRKCPDVVDVEAASLSPGFVDDSCCGVVVAADYLGRCTVVVALSEAGRIRHVRYVASRRTAPFLGPIWAVSGTTGTRRSRELPTPLPIGAMRAAATRFRSIRRAHSGQIRIAPRGRCQLAARGLIAETSVPARAVSMS